MKRINYAPGPYVSFCVDCDAEFMGHKFAVRCEQCAAQVDRSPEGGDRETGRHAEHENAVGDSRDAQGEAA